MNGDRRRELEAQLSAYLDDELRPEERREVEALLADDADARALLERLRATVEAVRALPRARASDRMIESLRSRMERRSLLEGPSRPVHAGGGRVYLRWTAAAAVIGLAVTAGYLMWPWVGQDGRHSARHYALNEKQPTSEALSQESAEESVADEFARRAPGAPLAGDRLEEQRLNPPVLSIPPSAPSMAGGPRLGADDARIGIEMDSALAEADDRESAPPPAMESIPQAADGFAFADLSEGEIEPSGKPADARADSPADAGGDRPRTVTAMLTLADAGNRHKTLSWLREEYAFQPVETKLRGRAGEGGLEIRVPDEESARRVVRSLRSSLEAGNELYITNGAVVLAEPDNGREAEAQSSDMRAISAQSAQESPAGHTAESRATSGYRQPGGWGDGGVGTFGGFEIESVESDEHIVDRVADRADSASMPESAPAALARRQLEQEVTAGLRARALAKSGTQPAEAAEPAFESKDVSVAAPARTTREPAGGRSTINGRGFFGDPRTIQLRIRIEPPATRAAQSTTRPIDHP